MIQLRPDQWTSVRALSTALAEGARRVLVQGPTGWGKGSVAAYVLATRAARHGRRSAFICHRGEILSDVANRLRSAGAPSVRLLLHGRAEGPEDAAVTVLSIQTIDAREWDLSTLGPDGLAWWDEAHRCAAATYEQARERASGITHVGSTATPARADNKPLKFFERLIPGPQIADLVQAGLLAPITVYAPDEAVDELAQDPCDVVIKGEPTVVFASSVDHSIAIAGELERRGHRVAHVDGRTPKSERAALIAGFNAGALDVLTNYQLLVEGVDLPRCSDIVLARKIESVVAWLQSIGRARRPQPGKRARLRDLHGSMWLPGNRHPDVTRTFSLDGKAIRASEEPAIGQCKVCLAWTTPGKCDVCGARVESKPKPAPKITKRELKEQAQDAQPREGGEWDLWVELVTRYRARGWKIQGAGLEFHRRTGRFPRWRVDHVPDEARTA